ncbi:hypothetical protein BKA62DRAFT_773867 [Auriculariales sp. MPI-PUGE-AT-0066]|nr:hypothetical protein BKA62DRAFT_773867 [Auriculariales sp. MPI-PUGE-AT-0066]
MQSNQEQYYDPSALYAYPQQVYAYDGYDGSWQQQTINYDSSLLFAPPYETMAMDMGMMVSTVDPSMLCVPSPAAAPPAQLPVYGSYTSMQANYESVAAPHYPVTTTSQPVHTPILAPAAFCEDDEMDAEGSDDDEYEPERDGESDESDGDDDGEWTPAAMIRGRKPAAPTRTYSIFQRSPTAVTTDVSDDATVVSSPAYQSKLAQLDDSQLSSSQGSASAAVAPVPLPTLPLSPIAKFRKSDHINNNNNSAVKSRRRRAGSSASADASIAVPPPYASYSSSGGAQPGAFECGYDGCGKQYSRKAELERHTLSHTSAPCVCKICGAVLKTNRTDVLRRHQLMTAECVRLQSEMHNAELKRKGCVTHQERELAMQRIRDKVAAAGPKGKGAGTARKSRASKRKEVY